MLYGPRIGNIITISILKAYLEKRKNIAVLDFSKKPWLKTSNFSRGIIFGKIIVFNIHVFESTLYQNVYKVISWF